MRKSLLSGVILILLMLQGCSTSRFVLSALPPIKNAVNLDAVWRTGVDVNFSESGESYNLVAQDGSLFFVTDRGSVYQLEQKNGVKIERIKTDYKPSSGLTRVGDSVYFGTYGAQLVSVSLKNKKVNWVKTVSSEVLSEPGYGSGRLAVQTGDGWLIVMDSQTGNILWRAKKDLPTLTMHGTSAPVIVDGKVIVGFSDGRVNVYDLQTGEERWSYAVGKPEGRCEVERLDDVDGRLLVRDGTVYAVAHNGTLTALSLQTGRPFWKRNIPSNVGVAVRNNLLVIVSQDNTVYGLDVKNGLEIWKNSTFLSRDLVSPEFFRYYVAVMDRGSHVYLLDLKTGKEKARNMLVDDVIFKSQMVASGNQLFILMPGSGVTALSY